MSTPHGGVLSSLWLFQQLVQYAEPSPALDLPPLKSSAEQSRVATHIITDHVTKY